MSLLTALPYVLEFVYTQPAVKAQNISLLEELVISFSEIFSTSTTNPHQIF